MRTFDSFVGQARFAIVIAILTTIAWLGIVYGTSNGFSVGEMMQRSAPVYGVLAAFGLIFGAYRAKLALRDVLWTNITAIGAIALVFFLAMYPLIHWIISVAMGIGAAWFLSYKLGEDFAESGGQREMLWVTFVALAGSFATFALIYIKGGPELGTLIPACVGLALAFGWLQRPAWAGQPVTG